MEYALSDITDDGPFLNLRKDIIIVGCLICNNIYIAKNHNLFSLWWKWKKNAILPWKICLQSGFDPACIIPDSTKIGNEQINGRVQEGE